MNLLQQITIQHFIGQLHQIPKRTAVAVIFPFVFFIILLQWLAVSQSGALIDQKMYYPVVFQMREYFDRKTPSLFGTSGRDLDAKIKLFSFDDTTVSHEKSLDLSLATWVKLFEEISKIDGVRLVVPKLFDSPYTAKELLDADPILEAIQSRIKITPIAFTDPHAIAYRQPISDALLQSNQPEAPHRVELAQYLNSSTNTLSSATNATDVAPHVYGASESLLRRFAHFGHAEYTGNFHIKPFVRLDHDTLLPFVSLTLAETMDLQPQNIMINGHRLFLDGAGNALVNFRPAATYDRRAYSLLPLVERARRKMNLSIIKPGDLVVILPSMFTGNTAFSETPFGMMPSAYVILAVMESVIGGQWLHEWHDPGVVTLTFGLLASIFGFSWRSKWAIGLFILILGAMFGLSLVLFAKFGIAWSFILPSVAFFSGCLAGHILQNSVTALTEERMQREIEVATLVQKSFFVPATSSVSTVSTSPVSTSPVLTVGKFVPASECGGDWWSRFDRQMGDGTYTYVMLGDAVGHGVPAALVTAVAFTVANIFEHPSTDPGQTPPMISPATVMQSINRVLCSMQSDLACMTFVALRIDHRTGETVYANAGNPQPILIPPSAGDPRLAKGQRTKTLLARGNVLGLTVDSTFEEQSFVLEPRDKLLLFTDGLFENRSAKTQKPLGKVWLKSTTTKIADTDATEFGSKIWEAYHHELGRSVPDDDVTVVVLSR